MAGFCWWLAGIVMWFRSMQGMKKQACLPTPEIVLKQVSPSALSLLIDKFPYKPYVLFPVFLSIPILLDFLVSELCGTLKKGRVCSIAFKS